MSFNKQFTKTGVLLLKYLFKWLTGPMLLTFLTATYLLAGFLILTALFLVFILKLPLKCYSIFEDQLKGLLS